MEGNMNQKKGQFSFQAEFRENICKLAGLEHKSLFFFPDSPSPKGFQSKKWPEGATSKMLSYLRQRVHGCNTYFKTS